MTQTEQTIRPWYKSSILWPIPKDWGIVELWSLCKIVKSWWTPNSSNELFYNWNIPFLSINDMTNQWKYIYYTQNFISQEWLENSSSWIVPPNSLIYSMYASVWLVSINKIPLATSQAVLNLILKEEENIDYLYYYLIFIKQFTKKFIVTWTQWNLNAQIVKTFKVVLPETSEQQVIANILKIVDNAIGIVESIIKNLENRNKWLQQALLTGKIRLKWFEKTKLQFLPIKSFSKEISEKNRNNEDLIVLSCTKYDWLVPSLEYFWRKIYSDDLTTYKIVHKNCFAYATNHIEEWSIWYQSKYEKTLISPMYTVFKTNETMDDEYLFKLLKTHYYIHEYQKRMEWSIDRRGWLRWDEFSKIKVPVPSLDEQRAIANIFNKTIEEVNLYKQKLEKLQLVKKWLMQQLLTGKVRVNVK